MAGAADRGGGLAASRSAGGGRFGGLCQMNSPQPHHPFCRGWGDEGRRGVSRCRPDSAKGGGWRRIARSGEATMSLATPCESGMSEPCLPQPTSPATHGTPGGREAFHDPRLRRLTSCLQAVCIWNALTIDSHPQTSGKRRRGRAPLKHNAEGARAAPHARTRRSVTSPP